VKIIRAVAAVLAGLIAAGLVVFVVELVSSAVYPPPPGLDLTDQTALERHVSSLPPGAFAFVLGAWAAGAFVGVWVATRIAQSAVAGLVVAVLFFGACLANLFMLPHPAWFWAAAIILIVVSAIVALRLGTTARTMRAA
jgi:hypothetical protein